MSVFGEGIGTQAQVKAEVPAIRNGLHELGIRVDPGVRVRLVTPGEMRQLARDVRRSGPRGESTAHIVGVTTGYSGTVTDLAVISGLHRLEFGSVVVHEAMHAWLFQHHLDHLRLEVAEGLCTVASYAWLRRQPALRARLLRAGMMASPDPVYGAGFRTVFASVRAHGIKRVLTSLETVGDLP